MISELRRAFEIGFLIIMPFLVIDMVVATLTMSMGMMMMPPTVFALPFKVLFFVLIDGWNSSRSAWSGRFSRMSTRRIRSFALVGLVQL